MNRPDAVSQSHAAPLSTVFRGVEIPHSSGDMRKRPAGDPAACSCARGRRGRGISRQDGRITRLLRLTTPDLFESNKQDIEYRRRRRRQRRRRRRRRRRRSAEAPFQALVIAIQCRERKGNFQVDTAWDRGYVSVASLYQFHYLDTTPKTAVTD